MLFEILGPLRMQGTVRLGSPVRSAVLTALLLRDGQALSISELSEMLWETPPRSALANVRSHLTALRRDLDEASPGASRRLSTHRGTQCSYRLEVAPEELDLSAFRRATHRGRTLLQAGDAEAAITVLEEALALWRGPFGQDLPPTRWFNNHVAGVNSIRFCAYQDLFTAYVLTRRTQMLSYRIEGVIAEAPYRQRLWELLAATHCLEDDAAGALQVVKRCQELFADDLGLDLPPNVEAMRTAALNWDGDLALRLIAPAMSRDDGRWAVGERAGTAVSDVAVRSAEAAQGAAPRPRSSVDDPGAVLRR